MVRVLPANSRQSFVVDPKGKGEQQINIYPESLLTITSAGRSKSSSRR